MEGFRQIRQLSRVEEIMILNAILNDKLFHFDTGSSRMVMLELGENTINVLNKLGIDGCHCVIKINCGASGCAQSRFERDVYENATPSQVKYLANIYAYGSSIQIMEKLNVRYHGFFQELYEDYYWSGTSTSVTREIESVIRWEAPSESETPALIELLSNGADDFLTNYLPAMEEVVGDVGDNDQVGFDRNGNIKCYDYGYFDGATHEEYCSGATDDIAYSTVCMNDYLNQIIGFEGVLDPNGLETIMYNVVDC